MSRLVAGSAILAIHKYTSNVRVRPKSKWTENKYVPNSSGTILDLLVSLALLLQAAGTLNTLPMRGEILANT